MLALMVELLRVVNIVYQKGWLRETRWQPSAASLMEPRLLHDYLQELEYAHVLYIRKHCWERW